MKILLVIRHAKSSWKDPSLTDLQRPLKKRGEKNAQEIAARLQGEKLQYERVYSSPANRAIQTVELMQQAGTFNEDALEIASELYSFDYGDVMRYLREIDSVYNCVAMVGHNPAITDLVNFLALESIRNIPTCGFALMKLGISNWTELKAGCATLVRYDFPKNDPSVDV